MLTTYGKQDDAEDPQGEHHLRQCLESANAILIIFIFFTKSFGHGHIITSQAYSVYIAASVFLLQVQATKDFTSQAMESLKFCVDSLERIKTTSPGESVCAREQPDYILKYTHSVIGSALVLIYRELQVLDSNLIARNLDGSYHMSGLPNFAWQRSDEQMAGSGSSHTDTGWTGNSQDPAAFAVPNFDALDIPTDFFTMLPDLEPISANVNAGFDIDLDKPWY